MFNVLCENPRRVFLIDGIGALLSALFLGVILVQLNPLTGVPIRTLKFLAVFPVAYAVYDFLCYLMLKQNFSFWIRLVAAANAIYIIVSLFLLYQHVASLTPWGIIYFLTEIVILIYLVRLQLNVATALRSKP